MTWAFEDVLQLVQRNKVALYDESDPRQDAHKAGMVFTRFIPERLLEERMEMLIRGVGVWPWYLLDEDPLGEWGEELRGDYGVLVVLVKAEELLTLRSLNQ